LTCPHGGRRGAPTIGSYGKIIVLALVLLFFGCGLYMHLRGKVRHKVVKQLFDHPRSQRRSTSSC
jgi:hypothetical protein